MDKFRRNQKTSSSPTKTQPATSSIEASSSSTTSAATKFTIQQKIPSGTVAKKGPYSVKRTVDPNEVVIKRRIGEGAKPLFSREELQARKSQSPKQKKAPPSRSSSSSSGSSSPVERNRNRNTTEKSNSKPTQKKSEEKVPYFLDQKREKDRIRRIYGPRRSRSLSPVKGRPYARNRSRSPPYYQRHRSSHGERRTPSRERYRSRYRRTYSRSRSRSRERRDRSSHDYHQRSIYDGRPLPPPAPQFIPVPVPVEYPYIQAWGPPMMPPHPRFPMMLRPPYPVPMQFIPRRFPPARFIRPNNYRMGNLNPRQRMGQ